MYMAMKLCNFDFEAVNFPFPTQVDTGKMIGFIPVYETLEDLQAEYPDAQYMEIKKGS